MTKVFIGGSRRVSRLSGEVRQRVDTILCKGFPIVVGDANGADRAVQQYLSDKQYADVEVFCSGGVCRNNVGGWPVRSVPVRSRERTADFYSQKDRAMAKEATVGLMLWDGGSVGTLMNVLRLLRLNKKAVLYVVPERRFFELRGVEDWRDFIGRCDSSLRRRLEQRAGLDAPATADTIAQGSAL